MSYSRGYPRYVPVAERAARAQKQAEKLAKKKGALQPVVLDGKTLARSWWGKSWNANLERYADYSNRIGRGRSYLRQGMVLDLKVEGTVVHALVAGSRPKPYAITITIKPLAPARLKKLAAIASAQVGSMQSLLQGEFPPDLKEVFFTPKEGLFPTPSEISFECSCPDWASMCKHVAAALYGIGARLDSAPELFFALRGIDMNDLVGNIVRQETTRILTKTKALPTAASSRILQPDAALEELFGISLELPPTLPLKKGRRGK
jgi:uncharacterized Zn finger protein